MENSIVGLWFLILGEPMQVTDEARTTKGKHLVWLRGPRHIYARQREEMHEASILNTPATRDEVVQAAWRYSERLKADQDALDLWKQGMAIC